MRSQKNAEQVVRKNTRASLRLVRLTLFGLVIILCLAAASLLYVRWRDARMPLGEISAGDNPTLNPLRRLFLQAYLAANVDELNRPVGEGNGQISFIITPGESANQIAGNLAAAGMLQNTDLFLNYVRYHGLDAKLEAGTYKLDPQQTLPELAVTLTDALPQEVELRFIEGWRLEEMFGYLDRIRPAEIDPDEFLDIVQRSQALELSGYDFLASLPDNATLEGFLFPDTYRVPLDAKAEDIVVMMLDNFGERVSPSMRQSFGHQGLTVFEAVSLASIVQREAVVPEERPLMVGVFLNRLNLMMPLQADPTVQYAIGYQTASGSWWKSPLDRTDLEVDSAYNTYRHEGLPPGPIANPGLAALEAVANPTTTTFLYFVVDCTAVDRGSHVFSTSYEEHLANVERCR